MFLLRRIRKLIGPVILYQLGHFSRVKTDNSLRDGCRWHARPARSIYQRIKRVDDGGGVRPVRGEANGVRCRSSVGRWINIDGDGDASQSS
jgi:hypothetical protein